MDDKQRLDVTADEQTYDSAVAVKHLLRLLLPAGIVIMLAASVWAPPQPELLVTGACQMAPCGTLEDPARWRAAWWLWTVGLFATSVGAIFMAPPLPSLRPLNIGLVFLLSPVWVALTGIIAVLVALFTSIHGAATVAAVFLLAPALALLAGAVERHPAKT